MPSRKKRLIAENPWWYSPSIDQIIAIPELLEQLPSLRIQRIFNAMANDPYPTNRPKRARRKWIETQTVDGVECRMSCIVEADKIVVKNISFPRGAWGIEPKRKRKGR